MDYVQLWKKALAQIEIKIPKLTDIKDSLVFSKIESINGNELLLLVPSVFCKDRVEKKYKKDFEEILIGICQRPIKIKVQTSTDLKKKLEDSMKADSTGISRVDNLFTLESNTSQFLSDKLKLSNLQLRHTFEQYVVGDSNRFAHAAALNVSKNPGTAYNPLYIHGPTGMGKTHLAQAIGRAIIESDYTKKILYIPSETFLNELISTIKTNSTSEFRKKYRNLDVLIIDDIQLISKWVETQTEFFNTFNSLIMANAHIILISDRPPEELQKVEERLKSRFQGGLVTHVGLPEYETRIAILNKKCKELKFDLSPNVLEYIAQIVNSNIRELEGSLQTVNLFAQATNKPSLSLDEVKTILRKTDDKVRKTANPSEIIKKVAENYDVTEKEIKGVGRSADVALARQVVMYILREEFKLRLEKIADLLNRSDHSTVIHGVNKIKDKILMDAVFKAEIDNLLK